MRIALYAPDIPQNTGTILRFAACLGLPVDLIGPAGFDASDRAFRRAGLDYLDHVTLVRHLDFDSFDVVRRGRGERLVLLTTKSARSYTEVAYCRSDILLVGRETSGVPKTVRGAADVSVRVPLREGLRSLNVAIALAMVAGEALRQTGGFPGD
ncbi:MAG: tRNA (cytidine(34)-2'-O)-methyltransferase [Hyphomicrobiaceae bacterium]|nr:MAG: tRNA (cytidine(34)-2'-O)-methyltransferase [Hyphomicrobiaceae bacterium]